MADLFTHLAAARVPAAFQRDRRLSALLVIGTFLPDVAAKGLYWVLRTDSDFTLPTHSILGLVVLSYAAALWIEERLRGRAFVAILAGGLIHVGVDLLKENLGMGSAYLFYPFSTRSYELGLIDPLDVVWLLPIDVLILVLAWIIERRRARVQQ